jgi:PIN domain nuclease of toxin-antitoxin system
VLDPGPDDARDAARDGLALPFHHWDPFDRLLVAQAIDSDLTIVSADPVFRQYGVRRVW